MGWNRVRQEFAHPLWAGIPDESWFYFVHSFHAAPSEAPPQRRHHRIRRPLYLGRGPG